MIHRSRVDRDGEAKAWLSIPGGGIESSEEPEVAVTRELREEMGVALGSKKLVLVQHVDDATTEHHDEHHYFLCEMSDETADISLRAESEEHSRSLRGSDVYQPAWVPFDADETIDNLHPPYRHAYRLVLALRQTLDSPDEFRDVLPLRIRGESRVTTAGVKTMPIG